MNCNEEQLNSMIVGFDYILNDMREHGVDVGEISIDFVSLEGLIEALRELKLRRGDD